MIKTQKFVRKPVHVDAVRITRNNFEEVAKWCQGEILEDPHGRGSRRRYIHVRVHNPKNDRQKMAYVGDWLLYTDRGYKIYTNKAFNQSFALAEGFADLVAEARRTLEEAEKETLTEEQVRASAGYPSAPIEAVPSEGREITDAKLHSVSLMSEGGPEDGVQPIIEVSEPSAEAYPETQTVGGTSADEINVGVDVSQIQDATAFVGGHTTVDGWGSGDVREDVIAAEQSADVDGVEAPSQEISPEAYAERVLPAPVHESLEMAEARKTIESEGGTIEEATPEAIVDVVAEQERARVAAEAAGKRVISEEEQKEMDPEEIKGLLQSGDAILAQDLAA